MVLNIGIIGKTWELVVVVGAPPSWGICHLLFWWFVDVLGLPHPSPLLWGVQLLELWCFGFECLLRRGSVNFHKSGIRLLPSFHGSTWAPSSFGAYQFWWSSWSQWPSSPAFPCPFRGEPDPSSVWSFYPPSCQVGRWLPYRPGVKSRLMFQDVTG